MGRRYNRAKNNEICFSYFHSFASLLHNLNCAYFSSGVYFPKYVRDICQQLGICGWVKNTKSGTILGKMQGPRALIDQM